VIEDQLDSNRPIQGVKESRLIEQARLWRPNARLSWARKMQSGLWLYSNTPFHRRNQLSRAKMNSPQSGRLWPLAPAKI
jgi:hypothetical protein